MSFDPTNADGPGLFERIKDILFTPQAEWDRIATERADLGALYRGYVLPLALLSGAAAFVGWSLIGAAPLGARVPMLTGAVMAGVHAAALVAGVFVVAILVNLFAPRFRARQDSDQAHKLAVYSATAALLAGVFQALDPLAIFAVAGLYSLALLFIGLPRLMNAPEDTRIGYAATVAVVALIVHIVINSTVTFAGAVMNDLAPPPRPAIETEADASVGGIDFSQLERANALGRAVAPERVLNFVPDSLPGGFHRTSTSSSTSAGVTQAAGEYANGEAHLTLTIFHTGAVGGLAAIAATMNLQESRSDDAGYIRTQNVDGRIISEEVSYTDGRTRYSVVGRGVAITAAGRGGVTIDQVRAAVDTIGVRRLENAFKN